MASKYQQRPCSVCTKPKGINSYPAGGNVCRSCAKKASDRKAADDEKLSIELAKADQVILDARVAIGGTGPL